MLTSFPLPIHCSMAATAGLSPQDRARALSAHEGPTFVDLAKEAGEAIRAAGLKVAVDPLYGAGRSYLAGALRSIGRARRACQAPFI